MERPCLDVPKALETIISCEALHQECGTLHKGPLFGHLQQLQPQSSDRAQICGVSFYTICGVHDTVKTCTIRLLLKQEATEKLLECEKGKSTEYPS